MARLSWLEKNSHNRYANCAEHDIWFNTVQMHFESEDDVKGWIIENQLGRRNLTPDQFKLFLGRKYNRLKKSQGGTGANQHNEQNRQNDGSAHTSNTLAGEHGVSSRTVKRAGAAAEAIDTQGSPELVDAVTQGDIPVAAVAAIAELPEDEQAEVLDEIESGVKPTEAARAVMGKIDLFYRWGALFAGARGDV